MCFFFEKNFIGGVYKHLCDFVFYILFMVLLMPFDIVHTSGNFWFFSNVVVCIMHSLDGSESHLIKIGKYAAYVAPAKNEKKTE